MRRRHPAAAGSARVRRLARAITALAAAGLLVAAAGCGSGDDGSSAGSTTTSDAPSPTDTGAPGSTAAAGPMPRPDHVVVVIEENRPYGGIVGNPSAPYLNSLARGGVSLTDWTAVTHPSEPNYLALFSGSTHGLTDDSCPHTYSGDTLATQLTATGHTFAGYSEDLPSPGYTGCTHGDYARKHNPWVDFPSTTPAQNQPFTAFPADYSALPTVSFVIPNLAHDMHDGSIAQGDSWLRDHLSGYADWAATHNSLLVVTWDEDDNSGDNRIPTIVAGAGVTPGESAQSGTHYSLLRTLESVYGLPSLGEAAGTQPITGVWSGR